MGAWVYVCGLVNTEKIMVTLEYACKASSKLIKLRTAEGAIV